jgi:hypothetical protein
MMIEVTRRVTRATYSLGLSTAKVGSDEIKNQSPNPHAGVCGDRVGRDDRDDDRQRSKAVIEN